MFHRLLTLIEQSLHEVIANPEKHRQALNYGGPKGAGNLVTFIRDFLIKNKIGDLIEPILERNEIIIAPSGATYSRHPPYSQNPFKNGSSRVLFS